MKAMAKYLIPNAGTLIIVGLLFLAQSVGAAPGKVPTETLAPSQTLISYQGTLTDQNGNPINGTVTMEFALHDAATDGSMLWGPETQSVQVSNGLFSVLLGSVLPIDPGDLYLGGTLYLDITVNGESLTPRELLSSVASAIDVRRVFLKNPNNEAASVQLGWTNDVARIRIGGSGVGAFNGLDIQTIGNTSLMRLLHNGNIGIGTTSPSARLHVVAAQGQALLATGTVNLWGTVGMHDNVYISENLFVTGGGSFGADLNMNGNAVTNCGALTEANLQTEEELAAERIDRFEEGDLLCWGEGQLEKCDRASDPLVQAVADRDGRPIVIGAELVKVVGPVERGDFLVASGVPGYAIATDEPAFGTVIAQALEDFERDQGIIKAMIRKM